MVRLVCVVVGIAALTAATNCSNSTCNSNTSNTTAPPTPAPSFVGPPPPTAQPAGVPTSAPSSTPSSAPSPAPSPAPSVAPSAAPTDFCSDNICLNGGVCSAGACNCTTGFAGRLCQGATTPNPPAGSAVVRGRVTINIPGCDFSNNAFSSALAASLMGVEADAVIVTNVTKAGCSISVGRRSGADASIDYYIRTTKNEARNVAEAVSTLTPAAFTIALENAGATAYSAQSISSPALVYSEADGVDCARDPNDCSKAPCEGGETLVTCTLLQAAQFGGAACAPPRVETCGTAEDDGLGAGAIAGIVIGCLVVLGGVAYAISSKSKEAGEEQEDATDPQDEEALVSLGSKNKEAGHPGRSAKVGQAPTSGEQKEETLHAV
eukprot:CAMPEP_0205820564 /NCGR_PEP_ID=MMETSP0206-20130828/3213_1 /ASSEMBLY_ACC=CAM_ASM_000279 /TAXON_ID=36767 /ORGANISM="Euplotes focardii, Strain TN1" /LENGTH=378 /DNA_ID=CAMNT_0053115397 /DNA_START=23 /DNA_END=1159 /DNA_ORIENTATION=+